MRLFWVILVAIVVILVVAEAKRNGGKRRQRLSNENKEALKKNCRGKRNCREQRKMAQERRQLSKRALIERLKSENRNDQEAEVEAEKTLKAIHTAKKAVFEANGMSDVEPDDNGVWQHDISLTIAQAEAIATKAKDEEAPPIEVGGESSSDNGPPDRKKRSSLFLDYFIGNKWTSPVPYYIDPRFTSTQRSTVLAAINNIQSQTCVKFVENSGLTGQPQIYFTNYPGVTSPGTCGQSPMGKTTRNTINLNFQSYCAQQGKMVGTVVHEILHSLGIGHQQNRIDRDKYIKVDWSNIDPQSFDVYGHDEPSEGYTTFGVPYDYASVMHYGLYVGAEDTSRPAATPIQNPTLWLSRVGTANGLSANDKLLLQKMYCRSASCVDNNAGCGYWSGLNYCTTGIYVPWMKSNCAKTCNICQ